MGSRTDPIIFGLLFETKNYTLKTVPQGLTILLNVIGLLAGFVSILLLFFTFSRGPNITRPALTQLIIGLTFVGLAFFADIISEMGFLETVSSVNFSRIAMVLASLFFVNSARIFYRIGR